MRVTDRFRLFFEAASQRRFTCSATTLSVVVGSYVFAFFNMTFWSKGLGIFSGHLGQLLIFNTAVFLLLMSLFFLFSFRFLARPFLAFILVLGAITSFYMDTLGVIIDRDMIQNVATTTFTESKHLLTPEFVLHVFWFGVLPAILLVVFFRVRPMKRWFSAAIPIVLSVLCVVTAAGLLMTNYKTYASVLRERKDFMSSFQPGAPIVGTIRYVKMMAANTNVVVAPLGEDAQKSASFKSHTKPTLTIIVAGETARSQNFSLNGYDVPTNPELSTKPVISFSNVSSCGTATAVSLPCMFSKYTRNDYSFDKGIATESVLDVLSHAGFHVEWWDNNTGDKGVAARLPVTALTHTENEEFCSAGECTDGIFLQRLRDYLPTITQDTVLVLHQIGSHGPTYYLRYPAEFEKFTPACRTAEFKNCTEQEIRNAYDNTIAYTDHILSQTIDILAEHDGLVTSLLYVSDHGESLGEGGLYLHGSPYFMAPEYQTKVPMILWMSNAFEKQMEFSSNCLAKLSDAALSHDNLFHSILGMLQVSTTEYQSKLDIFAQCANHNKLAVNE